MGPRGQKRREQLLQAALELFAANGYDATSTRSIAEQTGVTEAVLFKHFPSKRDLLLAVLERFGPAQYMQLPEEELAHLPLPEALTRKLTTYLDASWENRKVLFMLFQMARREPEAGGELRRQFEHVREALRQLLLQRARQGQVRPELVEAAVQTMVFALRGFNMRSWHHKAETREQDREVFVQSLVTVLCGGIAVETPGARRAAPLSLPETTPFAIGRESNA